MGFICYQKILIDPKFDLEGEHLGMKTVLAYLDPNLKGDKLLLGANFASAGVGILNDTGIQFVSQHNKYICMYIFIIKTEYSFSLLCV